MVNWPGSSRIRCSADRRGRPAVPCLDPMLRPIADGLQLCDGERATGQRCVHARIASLAAHWMPYREKRGASAAAIQHCAAIFPFVSPLRHHRATPRPGAASTLCGFQRGDRARRRFIPVLKFRRRAPERPSLLAKRTTRISGWSWQGEWRERAKQSQGAGRAA
jgi:hypothetical protein